MRQRVISLFAALCLEEGTAEDLSAFTDAG